MIMGKWVLLLCTFSERGYCSYPPFIPDVPTAVECVCRGLMNGADTPSVGLPLCMGGGGRLMFIAFLDRCWTCTEVTTETQGRWEGEEPIAEEDWVSGEGGQSKWWCCKGSRQFQGEFRSRTLVLYLSHMLCLCQAHLCYWGHAVVQWLRRCATSRKFAGSWPRWGGRIFSIYVFLLAALGPGVHSASAWQPNRHLQANCVDNVGTSMSHNPKGLHGLLQG
jgi:hypothetical protein